MRYGYWLPVFGGWLRNVEDEKHAGELGVCGNGWRNAAKSWGSI